jgi:hypothetical protein
LDLGSLIVEQAIQHFLGFDKFVKHVCPRPSSHLRCAFIGFVLVYLPARFLSWSGIVAPATTGAPQVAGMIMVTIGTVIALWCVFTFVFIGKGTPAPFDPPRKLVIRGPYRFVVKLIPRSTPNVFGVDAAHERFGIVFVVARLPPPQLFRLRSATARQAGAAGINAQTWAMLPKPPTLNYSSINDQLTLNHMLFAAAFSDRGWLKKC